MNYKLKDFTTEKKIEKRCQQITQIRLITQIREKEL
jgi:hypothetical protein